MNKTIIKPSELEARKYLKKWKNLESYVLQEKSLKKLFTKTYPKNKKIDEVLIKVCALNDFYSTNIFSPFAVGKHIVNLKIDKNLSKNDFGIVNKIAKIYIKGNKKNFYSFATKYCSHHNPEHYPIYDSFVEKVLMYFKGKDRFAEFKKEDLKKYPKYRNILTQFKKAYGLEKFNLKDIDRYLWQLGKEYYPKKYNKALV